MATEKQIEANQENGKLGGVKTEEGKDISKYNALKHGIFKQALTNYEADFHQDLFNDLVEQLSPEGFVETMLVERIAMCYLRLFRIAKVEKEYMLSRLSPRVVRNSFDFNMGEEVVQEGYIPVIGINTLENMNEKLLRYDTSIERSLLKALHELQRLQAQRKGENPALPLAVDIDISKE